MLVNRFHWSTERGLKVIGVLYILSNPQYLQQFSLSKQRKARQRREAAVQMLKRLLCLTLAAHYAKDIYQEAQLSCF